MGIFTGLFRSRDKPKNYYHSPSYAYWFGRSKSGAEVNPFTAMQQSAVYACIKVLAESVAQLPLHLYERTEHGKEPAVQHPLYKVLHDQPNPEMTSYTFREVLMTHLLIYGNASSSFAPSRLPNSLEMYASRSKAASLSSSVETFSAVPTLYAPRDFCPNVSSDNGKVPSSSIHDASPLSLTMGIFRSPDAVMITVASVRNTFSSSNASIS